MTLHGGKKPSKKYLQEAKNQVKKPREFAAFLRGFDMSDQDDVEEIEKLATKLSFPQRYWDFTPANILKAIDLLLDDAWPEVDLPMYTRGGTLTSEFTPLSIFALFGEVGFSFRTNGGKPMKIPREISADTLFAAYKGPNGKEVKPNPTLVISKKSLHVAVEDWKAFMLDHCFYHRQTRDAAFRSIVLGGEKAKLLWKGLIAKIGPLELEQAKTIVADTIDLGEEGAGDDGDDFSQFL